MARHLVPSFNVLWQRHESLYIRIFSKALEKLANVLVDNSNENTISRRLCPILTHVCFEESKRNNWEVRTPDWEKPIQPVTDSELAEGNASKRPDFTCKLTNPLANCVDEYEIPLHIECKRLGEATSATWILNENYVKNGIKRFDSTDHGYGKRASSGIMIGYITSMSPDTILADVNTYQKVSYPDNSDITIFSVKGKINEYNQKLIRKNLKPTQFKLIHLWVDLNKAV